MMQRCLFSISDSFRFFLQCLAWMGIGGGLGTAIASDPKINFQRDVRPILSNRCFACHGPDETKIEAGLRLDLSNSATQTLPSGNTAIVPGDIATSELIRRIESTDDDVRMPPPSFGAPLTAAEQGKLKQWIQGGAPFARHWSFVAPVRPELPIRSENPLSSENEDTKDANWGRNPIDAFTRDAMLRRGLEPSKEADRATLLRRLSMDLTGLPPEPQELREFVEDPSPLAYEAAVERLLASPTFGEHWARKWLDLARYADSAGYADDPARTIWAYRDWVVRAINQNLPFDQFTIEQLAGDLLPDPTDDQWVATAFHRNTLTNNEGGTNDEEFRNVAVVDRVNTTMAVWMGVTMACAQCHSHKYDPISQSEYFQVFAIFNQSQDADRGDESPRYDVVTQQQRQQLQSWTNELEKLREQLNTPVPELAVEQARWEDRVRPLTPWEALAPVEATTDTKGAVNLGLDSVQLIQGSDRDSITLTLDLPKGKNPRNLTSLQIRTLPNPGFPSGGAGFGGGNFVVSKVTIQAIPKQSRPLQGRFVRIELPGKGRILSLAEVEVLQAEKNVARTGTATQSSTDYGGEAARAIDGNPDGKYEINSTTHTAQSDNPWWEVDLGSLQEIDRIRVHNRTDGTVYDRLGGAKVSILDAERQILWSGTIEKGTLEPLAMEVVHQPMIPIQSAHADFEQAGFAARGVLDQDPETGWAVGGAHQQPHELSLVLGSWSEPKGSERNGNPTRVAEDEPWQLRLRIECQSKHAQHLLGSFQVRITSDPNAPATVATPTPVLTIIRSENERNTVDTSLVASYYQSKVAPSFQPIRDRIGLLESSLAGSKPVTSVPIMRDLPKEQHRETFVQLRGNYRAKGDVVQAGLPTAFHRTPTPSTSLDRLALAHWLMDPQNPLTARVLVNRYWEALFGTGIVRTSEEFGSQGDLPSHPELLDWLATEAIRRDWDTKEILRLIVTSATYRQDSSVNLHRLELDADNVYLSRGPRFRLSAEQVRDQALAIGGLLSHRMYGEPVKPRQPKLGLSAAFGSGTDWETSEGENSYRRGLYTTWRRSNPYPSMATFDAPNREVCTLRRDRTNTPLQALVTLNDPVYIEAAQGLARRILLRDAAGKSSEEQIRYAFELVTARPPNDREVHSLQKLLELNRIQFAQDAEGAKKMATDPLGPLPAGTDPLELAAWTVLGNVLLNLDEVLMTK